jgi:hypothetical protein
MPRRFLKTGSCSFSIWWCLRIEYTQYAGMPMTYTTMPTTHATTILKCLAEYAFCVRSFARYVSPSMGSGYT